MNPGWLLIAIGGGIAVAAVIVVLTGALIERERMAPDTALAVSGRPPGQHRAQPAALRDLDQHREDTAWLLDYADKLLGLKEMPR